MAERPTIHLYTNSWNEMRMLGFFFRHYDPFVDRYVFFDDNSDDGTLDVLRAHPRVVIRRFERSDRVARGFINREERADYLGGWAAVL